MGGGTVDCTEMGVPPSWTRKAAPPSEQLEGRDVLLDAFATPRRRLALAVVLDATEPVSVETLARRVTERETADAGREIAAETDAVAVSLRHVELPVLTDAGLVVCGPAGVEATELLRSSGRCRALRQLVDAPYPPDEVDAALRLLADPTSRTVLEQLATYERLPVEDLARAVVLDRPLTVATSDRVQRVALALQHKHVPKLVDLGIVERGDALRYVGTPVLDEWWPAVAETFTR